MASADRPYPGVRRTTVRTERATVALYEFAPGARFPLHRHAQEQITIVVEGTIEATVGDRRLVLMTAEAFVTAPDEPHGIVAGNAGARFVAVIVPPRGDEDDIEVLARQS
jgi:unsaturated pyranuronate lyase